MSTVLVGWKESIQGVALGKIFDRNNAGLCNAERYIQLGLCRFL